LTKSKDKVKRQSQKELPLFFKQQSGSRIKKYKHNFSHFKTVSSYQHINKMKIKYPIIVVFSIFFIACTGTEKSKQTEKKVEKTEEIIPVQKTVADYYREMLVAGGKDPNYIITEKDFDNNFMKITANEVLTEVYMWKIDDSTVLIGSHSFKKNYEQLPSFTKFDGKTPIPLKLEIVVENSAEMLKHINVVYPNSMRKKGHKNCCAVYGYLPKSKGSSIILVAENADAPNDLRDRSASKERVGTLEYTNGKFTFVKQ
jgi:hypothetical protein